MILPIQLLLLFCSLKIIQKLGVCDQEQIVYALPVPFVLALDHLELQDFVLRERLKRALSALSLEVCDAFAKVADHAHHLMDTLARLIALSDQAVDSRQGSCSRCNAFNNHGLTKLLVKELGQSNC